MFPSVIQTMSAQQSPFPDGALSTQSLAHGGVPELLLGLSYSATTGRLSAEVIKGSHFRNLAVTKPPGVCGRHHHRHNAGVSCDVSGLRGSRVPSSLPVQTPTPDCPS